ncbi:LOW QUALITY PROTEIN: Coiled-coil domain-containing protein 62, partial [Galemys pyrenaicus]
NIGSEAEISTIEKQRKELQLLIGELKDRDKELNDMVAVHQRQLLSWEEDRQKVLTLEERCSKLEGELHKRTEIIRSLTKKVKTLEANQIECQTALQKTQLQLQEMVQKATHSSLLSEDLEARNENLSNTLVELSAQVGQLQAREQALTTMIKLKDKDIIEAVNHISDCSGKFKLLEHALRDAKMVETCIVKEKQDYKQKLKALKIEVSKLKEDLNEKTTENNDQREEIIRLKQEKSCLHDELLFTEREKRKDELLDIAKSKQERTNAELHNLRQIYVKQQSDLQFLNFNMENSQELMQIYDSKVEGSKPLESSSRDMCLSDLENIYPKVDIKRVKNQKSPVKDQKFETMLSQQNRNNNKSSCDICKEKKLQVNNSFGEKSALAISSLLTKDLVEKQKPWLQGGTLQVEPESQSTLYRIHAKSESSLPDEKQWHDVSVYLGLASYSGPKQPGTLDAECQDHMERPRVSCYHKSEASPGETDTCDARCCHPSNFVIEVPGHMSDVEWVNLFKPPKMQRVVRHKSLCTCSGGGSGTKYNSTSELIAFQHSHSSDSSKPPSREDEKLIGTESPSDKNNSPRILSVGKDAALLGEKDDFSPTSKLQRLLAESRQMVTDLELSTLLPISSEKLLGSTRHVRASLLFPPGACPHVPVALPGAATLPVTGSVSVSEGEWLRAGLQEEEPDGPLEEGVGMRGGRTWAETRGVRAASRGRQQKRSREREEKGRSSSSSSRGRRGQSAQRVRSRGGPGSPCLPEPPRAPGLLLEPSARPWQAPMRGSGPARGHTQGWLGPLLVTGRLLGAAACALSPPLRRILSSCLTAAPLRLWAWGTLWLVTVEPPPPRTAPRSDVGSALPQSCRLSPLDLPAAPGSPRWLALLAQLLGVRRHAGAWESLRSAAPARQCRLGRSRSGPAGLRGSGGINAALTLKRFARSTGCQRLPRVARRVLRGRGRPAGDTAAREQEGQAGTRVLTPRVSLGEGPHSTPCPGSRRHPTPAAPAADFSQCLCGLSCSNPACTAFTPPQPGARPLRERWGALARCAPQSLPPRMLSKCLEWEGQEGAGRVHDLSYTLENIASHTLPLALRGGWLEPQTPASKRCSEQVSVQPCQRGPSPAAAGDTGLAQSLSLECALLAASSQRLLGTRPLATGATVGLPRSNSCSACHVSLQRESGNHPASCSSAKPSGRPPALGQGVTEPLDSAGTPQLLSKKSNHSKTGKGSQSETAPLTTSPATRSSRPRLRVGPGEPGVALGRHSDTS